MLIEKILNHLEDVTCFGTPFDLV